VAYEEANTDIIDPILMPIPRREVLRLCANGRAGVVDKDVETAKSLYGALDRLLTGCLVENIQLHKLGLGAERMQLRQRRLGLCLVSPCDDDRGARSGEALRHAESDAAISACYERNPFLQVENRHRRFSPHSISQS
jgi:hypothetical protein